MNILAIQAFSAIVETQSISQAAKILYVSQSTVSTRLKQLEDELNTPLIIRKKGYRNIHLTPKGEEFISIAERWLALWKDTCNLQSLKPNVPLSIGTTDSLNTYVFPELYRTLLEGNQQLDLHIRTHHSLEIYQLLANHQIDVGFVITPFAYKNILIEPLFTEKMVLICEPDTFPLNTVIHPRNLDCKNEIFTDWNLDFNNWHNFWFNASSIPRANFNNPSLILTFLENTQYWAIVPNTVAIAFSKIKAIQIHDIAEGPPHRTSYKITHKYPKPSRIENLNYLTQCLTTFRDLHLLNTF